MPAYVAWRMPQSARFPAQGPLWGRVAPIKGVRDGKGGALEELERLALKGIYKAGARAGVVRPSVAAAFQGLGRRRGGGGQGGDRSWWQAALSDGLRNGCASGLAAACAKLLLQPFDTVKTVQQVGPLWSATIVRRAWAYGLPCVITVRVHVYE